MMTILPHRFDNNERRRARDIAEDLHAILLAVDEAVLLRGIERMTALLLAARAANGVRDGRFDALLRGPTFLIGGEPQIPVCDENDSIGHLSLLWHSGGGIQDFKNSSKPASQRPCCDRSGWQHAASHPGLSLAGLSRTPASQFFAPCKQSRE